MTCPEAAALDRLLKAAYDRLGETDTPGDDRDLAGPACNSRCFGESAACSPNTVTRGACRGRRECRSRTTSPSSLSTASAR